MLKMNDLKLAIVKYFLSNHFHSHSDDMTFHYSYSDNYRIHRYNIQVPDMISYQRIINEITPDSEVHVAYMRPTWVLAAPGGPLVGPMNLAIRDVVATSLTTGMAHGTGSTSFNFDALKLLINCKIFPSQWNHERLRIHFNDGTASWHRDIRWLEYNWCSQRFTEVTFLGILWVFHRNLAWCIHFALTSTTHLGSTTVCSTVCSC